MLERLITYLKFGNHYYAVEYSQTDLEESLYGVSIKKKGKQLDIASSFRATSIEELKTNIPKGKALTLVINTKSVLTKKIQANHTESLKLVQTAFPNIKLEDFYYETLSQENFHFVSICRKTYIDELLVVYKDAGFNVVNFTLGNLVSVVPISYTDIESIQTSNARIAINNKGISDIDLDHSNFESNYNINGFTVTNKQILSFASILNLITNLKLTHSNFDNLRKELNSIFNQKQLAKQFLKIGLSGLFIALLVNFYYFNHYYNSVNSLRETTQILELSKTNLLNLNAKVERTEKMVNDVLKSSSSKSSFYLNAIVYDLPDHILLNEINYQPLIKRIKEDKPVENEKLVILVSGETYQRVLFSEWISMLEQKSWINSVDILNFEDSAKRKSNFSIKIKLNDTEE